MEKTNYTIEEMRTFLQSNLALLNISEISRRIEMDPNILRKAIKLENKSNGTTAIIPDECKAPLQNIISELKGALKITGIGKGQDNSCCK